MTDRPGPTPARDGALAATLVVGVDAGATSTRAVLATADGRVVGRGHAGGANVRSSVGRPADAVATALRAALAGQDTAMVRAGVIGMAGAAAAGRRRAVAAARAAWSMVRLPGTPLIVDDIAVAFAAGSPEPSGLVLIAGTGAGAAAVADGTVVRRVDGWGWLLGDEGSAVWLGLAAARAAMAASDGRGPATSLTALVSAALLGGPGPESPIAWAQAMIAACDRLRPAELGRLAPLVAEAASGGDAVAVGLVEAAAAKLLRTLAATAGPGRHDAASGANDQDGADRAGRGRNGGTGHDGAGGAGPDGRPLVPEQPAVIVLAGAMLEPAGPVGRLVTAGIAERWPAARVRRAGAGAGGAAWLALRALHAQREDGTPAPDATVHARLVGTDPPEPRDAG
jgi:glucosamine kinase